MSRRFPNDGSILLPCSDLDLSSAKSAGGVSVCADKQKCVKLLSCRWLTLRKYHSFEFPSRLKELWVQNIYEYMFVDYKAIFVETLSESLSAAWSVTGGTCCWCRARRETSWCGGYILSFSDCLSSQHCSFNNAIMYSLDQILLIIYHFPRQLTADIDTKFEFWEAGAKVSDVVDKFQSSE